MYLKQLLVDDDAVSPVIGVILMVAITVILAAVIGTFVLGIGQDQQTTPQASFDFTFENDTSTASAGGDLTITHTGGDSFTDDNANDLRVTSTGSFTGTSLSGSFPVEAGFSTSPLTVDNGATVRVIWEAPGGGETQAVANFNVPN